MFSVRVVLGFAFARRQNPGFSITAAIYRNGVHTGCVVGYGTHNHSGMGLFRKTLAVTSAIIAPGTGRGNQPGFIKYRSDAEELAREQNRLLKEQNDLLRSHSEPWPHPRGDRNPH